ncbi:MAG: hypothetical protein AB8H03_09735 [Saprospiraceae bacterium]
MNKVIHVNILALALLILVFVPQVLLSQAATITDEAAYQKMKQQFEAPKVSSEQLFLFEKKGIQHLNDFMNVVEMLSADEMDSKFKNRLKIAAEKYFSAPTDSLFLLDRNKINPISVNDFLEKLEKGNARFQEIELSNFESTTPVFLDKEYTWQASFLFAQKESVTRKMMAIFILKKEKKKFGSIEKEVWEVFLKRIIEEK